MSWNVMKHVPTLQLVDHILYTLAYVGPGTWPKPSIFKHTLFVTCFFVFDDNVSICVFRVKGVVGDDKHTCIKQF